MLLISLILKSLIVRIHGYLKQKELIINYSTNICIIINNIMQNNFRPNHLTTKDKT